MLPMLRREIVNRYGWATDEELLDYFAIGQCTPGVIAVNTATFIGRKIGGFWGAIVATAGVVLPSFLIILVIAAILQNVMHLEIVQHAFAGIRIGVTALITYTVCTLVKKSIPDAIGAGIALVAFVLVAFLNVSPIILVVAAGLLGILFAKARAPR